RSRERLDGRPVRQVAAMGDKLRAGLRRRDVGDQRLSRRLRRVVGEVDLEALGREAPDDTGADAARAAGDQDPPAHRSAAPKTRLTFCPPKPKELDRTYSGCALRATFGTTSSGKAGSGTS